MQITYSTNDYETMTENHICSFHQQHPSESFAGCTCNASNYQRRKSTESKKLEIDFTPTIYLPEKL